MDNQKQENYGKTLKEFRWFHWQIVRRHPKYRDFCDSHEFNDVGLLADDQTAQAAKIKETFSLNEIFHYSKDLSEQRCLDACKGRAAVVPIHPKTDFFNPEELPQYGDFVYVGINIAPDVRWKDIESQIRIHVEMMRYGRRIMSEINAAHAEERIKEVKNPEIRERLEKKKALLTSQNQRKWPSKDIGREHYETDLRSWDLHTQGKTPTEIIKAVWPDEYAKECSQGVDQRDIVHAELCKKYLDEGLSDYDERAYREAYGDSSTGKIKLYVRVNDSKKRMKSYFQMYSTD